MGVEGPMESPDAQKPWGKRCPLEVYSGQPWEGGWPPEHRALAGAHVTCWGSSDPAGDNGAHFTSRGLLTMVFNGCVWEAMTSLGPRPEQRRLESEAGGFPITETCMGLFCVRNEGAVRACTCVCVCTRAPMHVHLVLHRARGRRLLAQWGRQDLGRKTQGSGVRSSDVYPVPLCATPSARGSGE